MGCRGARGSGVGVKGSGVGNPHPYPWAPLPLTPRGYPDPWNSLVLDILYEYESITRSSDEGVRGSG